jgi:hypothetical protein
MLGALAVDDANDVHLLVGEGSAGRRQAEEPAAVSATMGAMDDGRIAFSDHPMNGPGLVREGLCEQVHDITAPPGPGGVPDGAS